MSNVHILDDVFNNFEKLISDYHDLPETEEAEDYFWQFVHQNILTNAEKNFDFENVLHGALSAKERQGFLYGFNYAIALLNR
ncbi:MAG: hypothetical protein HFI82_04620 [Eubacterium sp.]|jgi:hypothetical protein|nr:hypothetical protein [Eubacterium sp.]